MKILTNYFEKLNASLDYDEATNYIDETKSFIQNSLTTTGKCLVIGAGNLSDIPIEYLTKTFNEVILTDIDETAMKQNLDEKYHNVITMQVEYTGLDSIGLFDNLMSLIRMKKSENDIKQFIYTCTCENLNKTIISEFNRKFNFIYVSPIYTQLIYSQLAMSLEKGYEFGYQRYQILNLQAFCLEQMIVIIDRFNDLLISLLKNNGEIVVFSDYLGGKPSDQIIDQIIIKKNSQHDLNTIYQNYSNKYGFGLGDYGIYSICSKMNLLQERFFHWPLSKDKQYLVKGVFLNK